ncbi:beta-ketoacyl-ACP synthase 3 [Micromonospora sp. WMMD1082]|uniref:beta-ketoacyl-ACP synthase 3 n=1 Tax=Micromonospora sp. WMMD1082 TaxID=3016104 RepID=UPI0024160D6D|nr:beta-ketoacyl-ACP synthase 3 [Micromonospora sp. WMMD1082]MDG4794579.1 beta-ketoacyl-ACP synthase 3 [Micromonospora sp. WMMD1082]
MSTRRMTAGRLGQVGARVSGIGGYRPARVVHNKEICERIRSSDEWIQQRSGIVSRRFAGDDETVVSMGVQAARRALAHAGVEPHEVDTVIVASMSYLRQSPAAAPEIAKLIGAESAAAFDVAAACAGFCYALAVGASLVRSGVSEQVLVIGAEKMTDIIDPADRSTAFLFADGAGAALVGPSDENTVGPVVWGSDGGGKDLIGHSDSWLSLRDRSAPWPWMRMAGPEVFRWVIQSMLPVASSAVREAGLTVADLTAFVPHQANLRIIDRLAAGLRLPPSVVVARDVETSGNTSAASIPLAIEALLLSERAASAAGGLALLAGFGAGLAHAAMVIALPPPIPDATAAAAVPVDGTELGVIAPAGRR